YKIAGELTPTVFHVAARSLATQALSIFGDHSDVMATRATGFAMLASSSVQEAGDLAAIAHAATLESRLPFLHFFDGFRTSHEVAKVTAVGDDVLRALIDDDLVRAQRARALSPEHPVVRGTAQNPDVYFQARADGDERFITPPRVVGGRYGLSSKELTPAMLKAVFDELDRLRPRNHFTIGIHDDVTHTSLDWDPEFSTEPPDTVRAIFYGLGADGTVGANKNSIKIIGEETDGWAQGY